MPSREIRIALVAVAAALASAVASATGPSFDCTKVAAGSVEDRICKDPALAALDRELSQVVTAATSRIKNPHQPGLKAEQAGWLAVRNACSKSDDERACVQREYQRRIAYLQARYRLTPPRGPIRYVCDGKPANEASVTFFATEPTTVVIEYGGSDAVLYAEPTDGGEQYRGRNETFSPNQDEATLRWGRDAPEIKCARQP